MTEPRRYFPGKPRLLALGAALVSIAALGQPWIQGTDFSGNRGSADGLDLDQGIVSFCVCLAVLAVVAIGHRASAVIFGAAGVVMCGCAYSFYSQPGIALAAQLTDLVKPAFWWSTVVPGVGLLVAAVWGYVAAAPRSSDAASESPR